MAEICKMSRKKFGQVLGQLEEAGWISQQPQAAADQGQLPNLIQILRQP